MRWNSKRPGRVGEHAMIRKLWSAVKQIPSGYVLTDEDTGQLLTAEREHRWLTLAGR